MRYVVFGLILAILMGGPGLEALCAQGLDIQLKPSERGFRKPPPKEPSSAVLFADAVIGRPVGFATLIAGTTFFVATLPFTVGTGDVRTAARGLVKKPAGWTFKRPLGRRDYKFEDEGVFPQY